METSFELFLLDQKKSADVIALARRGADTAIEHLPIDAKLTALVDFGRALGKALTGDSQRPSANELQKFGNDLFDFLFRGSLRDLYNRLPGGAVSLQILTDRTEIKEIPWEYLVTPDCRPSPHRNRSVIRVLPTCGIYNPGPKQLGKKVKVLFVSADPVDQPGVAWEDVAAKITRNFIGLRLDDVSIDVASGATRESLTEAIAAKDFDVFHFFGHGEIRNGVGHLVLQGIKTDKSDLISATDLAVALAGKNVQLAILSACLSGAGNYSDDFGVIATALIYAGIPAVVANQYPIPVDSILPFVGRVYASLARDGDIDHAVAEGRIALSVGLSRGLGSGAAFEWGIPTLHRLADSKQLFL